MQQWTQKVLREENKYFNHVPKSALFAKTHLPLVLDLFTIQNAQQCDNTLPADIVFRYVLHNISSFRV